LLAFARRQTLKPKCSTSAQRADAERDDRTLIGSRIEIVTLGRTSRASSTPTPAVRDRA
jgi:hypothetical protein